MSSDVEAMSLGILDNYNYGNYVPRTFKRFNMYNSVDFSAKWEKGRGVWFYQAAVRAATHIITVRWPHYYRKAKSPDNNAHTGNKHGRYLVDVYRRYATQKSECARGNGACACMFNHCTFCDLYTSAIEPHTY